MTVAYMLDTDIISRFLHQGEPRLVALMRRLPLGHTIATSSINTFEIWRGHRKKPVRNLDALKRFLQGLEILPFTAESAVVAADLGQDLRDQGIPVGSEGFPGEADCLIAAIAICNDCTLLTGNGRHFQPMKELKMQAWPP